MPKYTVIAYREYTCYDKVYLGVEANSPEEALKLARAKPDDQDYNDSKTLDIGGGEWQDEDDWEVLDD